MLDFLSWILFGAIIGFLADLIDKKHSGGLITNIIIGILGSVVGGWLAGFIAPALNLPVQSGFNFVNIIFSVIGALIVLAIYRFVTGQK